MKIAWFFIAIVAVATASKLDPCFKKPEPGPCFGAFLRYFYNQETDQCEKFIWGGCLGSVPFNSLDECTKAKCTCKEKPDPGPCEAAIPSYFFNQTTNKCEKFFYGGCLGNVPFQTLKKCIAECEPQPDPCNEKPDPGPCDGYKPKYFFNQKIKRCEKFVWGGCDGNVPFDTSEDCKKKCGSNPCCELPDPGPCRGSLPRYFFNKRTQKCEMFTYGGCLGNVPFETLKECEHASCHLKD